MGSVDFADYFWGDRNDGFQVFYLLSNILIVNGRGHRDRNLKHNVMYKS